MPLGLIGEFRHIFTHERKIQVYTYVYIYIVLIVKRHHSDISNSEVQKHTPISFVSPPKSRNIPLPHFDNKGRGFTTKMKTSSKSSKQNHETANFRAPFGSESLSHRFDEVLSALLSDFRLEQELLFFFWSLECPPRGGVGCWWGFVGLDSDGVGFFF